MPQKILAVDDESSVLRAVSRILTRAGYEVITAKDFEEATRYAARLPFHAALVDLDLTGKDGLDVLARLREMQPSCLRILMTGTTDLRLVVQAVNRGEVLRVLRKPFTGPELQALLTDAFDSAKRMVRLAAAQRQAVDFQERRMLDDCVSNDRLRLALQPILPTGSARPWAYEALLRSSHPVLDTPIGVLKVAEQHERIPEIGREVFRLASEQIQHTPADVGLFINLHPQQLADPDQLARELSSLHRYSHRITLEITERSRLYDIERWEGSVNATMQMGFSLAIDDLGAGYNSLAMLADLQPRYIKLDMSLVRHVDTEPRKRRLVQLMSTFAEATEAFTIAEGVETLDEASALIDCGVHYMQGYLFAAPGLEEPPLLTRELVT